MSTDAMKSWPDVLAEALVGPYARTYLESATFHANIDSLAHMLPLWIEAMALAAESNDRQIQEAVRHLETEPFRWIVQ